MAGTRLECHAQDQILSRYGDQLAAIGTKAPIAMRDTLNREGRKGRKLIRMAMTRQTRLPASTIRRAVDPNTKTASTGNLEYRMGSHGGEVSLKFYKPKESRSGVKHTSPKVASPVPHSFTKGGSFSKGRSAKRSPVTTGEVWTRKDPSKFPLHKEKSGVWIPKEMVSGESRDQYNAISFRLADTLGKQIARYLPG